MHIYQVNQETEEIEFNNEEYQHFLSGEYHEKQIKSSETKGGRTIKT